eukprot:CAMPEP_0174740296 /NCGR_PEP_ID=MMETSP1094-20130205/73224_1 /TAXON_ID=156173 /ORGANISM="Chrysochromulina brevifilum, Strain UTEX LB 985" /LENGTH=35 /DNA_ID= /DNA_START= /DNA_END= /DNA_ORIENTATION=
MAASALRRLTSAALTLSTASAVASAASSRSLLPGD